MSGAATVSWNLATNEVMSAKLGCDSPPKALTTSPHLPVATVSGSEQIEPVALHERASVFKEEGDWYLLVHTTCKHLRSDNRCGIYETRPQICREYSTDNCEYEDDWTYDKYFETPEQIHEYAEAVLSHVDSPEFRSPRPPLLPVIG